MIMKKDSKGFSFSDLICIFAKVCITIAKCITCGNSKGEQL